MLIPLDYIIGGIFAFPQQYAPVDYTIINALALYMFENIAKNTVKKILFIILSLIIFITGCFMLLYIYGYARYIIAGLTGIGSGFFFLIAAFNSFFEPIYLFKNKVVRIVFPLLFTWGGFIVFIVFKRTELAALCSLLSAFTGYIFSGISPDLECNKPLFFLNAVVNWTFSRVFLTIFFFINVFNVLKKIYESGYIEFSL